MSATPSFLFRFTNKRSGDYQEALVKSVIDEYSHALEQVHTSTVRLFYHSMIKSKIHRKMWSDIPTAILSQINARFIECNVESLHRLHS